MDKKETYNSYNTLVCLVQGLKGENVLIDLRDEASVAGRVEDVDGFMNVTLSKVVYIDQKYQQFPMEMFTICARNIRHVHIPEHLKIKSVIADRLASHGFDKQVKHQRGRRKESAKARNREEKFVKAMKSNE